MPASLLSDGITSLGGYDQCLAIDDQHHFQHHHHLSEKEEVITKRRIRGQYCLLSLKANAKSSRENDALQDELQRTLQHLARVNRRFPLVLGLCIPSLCAPEEVNFLMKRYFSSDKLNFQTKVEHCQSRQDSILEQKPVLELLREHNLLIVSSILAAVAIFVLAGTLVDIVVFSVAKSNDQRSEHSFQKSRSQTRPSSFLDNLPKNKISKPAETPDTRIEHRLAFLHGIRVALVAWVVAAHSVALLPASIAMPVAMIARHPHDMLMLAEGSRLSSTFFNNGTLAVSLRSGLLLVALSLEKQSLLRRITFPLFVALRWLRFAPPLLGTIVFWKVASILGSGPFFAQSILQTSVQKPCQDGNWWRSFLFTNNWGNLSDTCIPPSWFLSADMQIHLLAYVLIVLLRRRLKTLFYLFCIVLISCSLAIPVLLLSFTGLKTFSNVDLFARSANNEETGENHITSYILLYTGAHVHMGAYFYGALLGYLLMGIVKSEKKKSIEKSPRSLFSDQLTGGLIWWSSLAVTVVFPFLSTTSQNSGLKHGLLVGGLHLIWTLAFGLVLLTLASNANLSSPVSTVKRLLSWAPFRPLSRLSFTIYLSHMLLIWFNVYTSRAPFEVNSGSITLFTLGIFAETIILSYLLFILFEAPSVNLIKLVFGGALNRSCEEEEPVLVKRENESEKVVTEKSETQFLANNISNNVCVPLTMVAV
ncbi:hypothetical protein TYRP_006323, partial [Tyrophagus putrescentiae]